MSPPPSQPYDVIIAGAGISGLGAAHNLAQGGRRVLLLESRDRTGGRIWSIPAPVSSHNPAVNGGEEKDKEATKSTTTTTTTPLIDLGASFVHGIIDNPLTALSKVVPFGLHIPAPEAGLAAYRPQAGGEMEDPSEYARWEYLSHLVTFERLHEYAQRGGPSGLGCGPTEEDSIESELLFQESVPNDTEGVWRGIDPSTRREVLKMNGLWTSWTGAELEDVSLKYWGWEREFRGEDAVVLPGYGKLIEWHVRQIESLGGEIRLNHKVDRVDLLDEQGRVSVGVVTQDRGRQTFEGKYFLCSLPLGVMQRAPPHFNPPLPPRRTAALNRLGMGLLNKIVVTYESAWWRTTPVENKDQPIGDWLILLESQHPPSPSSSARDLLLHSRLFGQDYSRINNSATLLFFLGPPLAQAVEDLPDEVIEEIIHKRIVASLFPSSSSSSSSSSPPPSRPIKTLTTRWLSDPNSFGSYSYFPSKRSSSSSSSSSSVTHGSKTNSCPSKEGGSPLDMLEAARPLWKDRLGFCGEHTEENCFASVHGPLMTGWREAGRISSLLREEDHDQEEEEEHKLKKNRTVDPLF